MDDEQSEWTISEVARLAGTTSRTLRHYQAEGLLHPSRVSDSGYRFYDQQGLLRLQRILLLRQLGLGIEAIRTALDSEPTAPTLRTHLTLLRQEQERLTRQIAAVEHTIRIEEKGGRIMAEKIFDGFDHTRYEDEVTERWGAAAYAEGDRWWRAASVEEREAFQTESAQLAADWTDAARSGVSPSSDEAQGLARRHYDWLLRAPGTPRDGAGALESDYLTGLGEMYVADDRFASNYGGTAGAEFVRDTLAHFAARHL